MTEFGIFTSEGLLERQLWTRGSAITRRDSYRAEHAGEYDPSEFTAEELCGDHEEQAASTCEECFSDIDAEGATA